MLDKPAITLQGVRAQRQPERLLLQVDIRNTEARTLYAYATVRRYQYDNATRLLTLSLHDRDLPDDEDFNKRHLPEPRMLPLEQNAVTAMSLDLPAVIHRIRDAQERQGGGDLIEEWPIAQASEVRLEVAHQDTPYYFNPARGAVAQLKEWGAQVATGTFTLQDGGAASAAGDVTPPHDDDGQGGGQAHRKHRGKGKK